jgi:bacterioferritin-associated ferredoxin
MILCLCCSISENEIKKAIEDDELESLMSQRKLGSVCGTCLPEFFEFIKTCQTNEQIESDD